MICNLVKPTDLKQRRKIILPLLSLTCFIIMASTVWLDVSESYASNCPTLLEGDRVIVQNTLNIGLRVRNAPGVSSKPLGRVYDDSQGTILSGPKPFGDHIWYEVKWDVLINGVDRGWSAGIINDNGSSFKTLKLTKEGDSAAKRRREISRRKDKIVKELFKLPASETYHDYNDYGCDPSQRIGYRGGHSGWDVQTTSVAGNKTAEVTFHSLTKGEVKTRVGDNFNTIAVYNRDDDRTTLYLHAREIFVSNGDQVDVGTPLGIQGNIGSAPKNDANTNEHVHIEVRKKETGYGSFGAGASQTTKNPNIDPIDYLYKSVTASVSVEDMVEPEQPEVKPPVGIEPAVVKISPSPIESPGVGKQLTINIAVEDGKNIAGYQATVEFDTTALQYVSSSNSDYLPDGAYSIPSIVEDNRVTLGATSLTGESEGNGTLATITFEVLAVKASTLTLSEVILTDNDARSLPVTVKNGQVIKPTRRPEDVNGDGKVNILDLAKVASLFGQTVQNKAEDVNGDGKVDIRDLVLVAKAFNTQQGAPSVYAIRSTLTADDVQQWINYAQQLNLNDLEFQKGITVLKQLLSTLTPNKTALLANYPNPFNPETWIPYQLAKPADVTLTIYSNEGKMIRILRLGHQAAGIYQSRNHAAYWDGKNQIGEPVASGIYYYTLTTGDFTATRKMLILK